MTSSAKKGFSLLECLIVVGILGILLTISLPTLKQYRESVILNASAIALASDLRALQNQAMLNHGIARLSLSALKPPAPIKILSFSSIAFSPSGLPIVGGSGTIVLGSSASISKKIIVSSLGRIRIE
ncbi:MAG: type II secretion system protein [Candidatus Margulisiibacteriota bacterium]